MVDPQDENYENIVYNSYYQVEKEKLGKFV